MIGEGFGEWFEAPSYEEGVGVDGGLQGEALNKRESGGIPQYGYAGQGPAKTEGYQSVALNQHKN